MKFGWKCTLVLIISLVFYLVCGNPIEKHKKNQEDTQAKIDSLVEAKKKKSGLSK